MRLRLHHLAIPHTVTHPDYVACAYTQKVRKFARMMTERGHDIIHYGHERSDVRCTEHVTVTDDQVLAQGDPDWRLHPFRVNIHDHAHQEFTRRTRPEIQARARSGDIVLANWGQGHQEIADAIQDPGVIVCEPGVGYSQGHFARWRAYESHAIRTLVEGAVNPQNWYNPVIPNYFDPEEFDYQEQKQDYVLFLGRVQQCKGVRTCVEATAAAGVELVIAGQGRLRDLGYPATPAHVREVGYADITQRRALLSRARALIIASEYLEPFGGVVVEALLSGTPIITPFFGAFAEINLPHETGYLCHDLQDYRDAICNAHRISPQACRQRGFQYTLGAVAPQFERWFWSLQRLYRGQGWNHLSG